MKIAVLTTDNREPDRAYSETQPRFGTGTDSFLEGVACMPEVEVHVVSCIQQPVRSPEKLGPNIWFHSLHVPKIGWLRTLYQGCIRATRRVLKQIQPDVVQSIGTERDCAICAVVSGFPNVVTIQGNMAELARLQRARIGSFGWLMARFENFTLPRAGGVICNSLYTKRLVDSRSGKSWVVYPGLRSVYLQPPTHTGRRECALVIAGVVSPRKRQLELLDVAEKLHRQGLKCEFRFVGYVFDSAYAKSFFKRIKPMEANGCARFLGTPSHQGMVECYDAAAGMVHFPTEEAFGSVVAEGLARDMKFFGARVGGVPEIVDGVPGTELFEIYDWAGLTDAIAKWIKAGCPSAPGTGTLMRERYRPEMFVRQTLGVFREVIGGSQ